MDLSLNLMVGLTKLRTIKLRGMVRNYGVVVVVDCETMRNFIMQKLVENLKLLVTKTTNYDVVMRTRTMVKG